MLAVTSFEAYISAFKKTNRTNTLSISTPGYWFPKAGGEETISKLKEILELRSQNDSELHVKKFDRRQQWIETASYTYSSTDFDAFEKKQLKN